MDINCTILNLLYFEYSARIIAIVILLHVVSQVQVFGIWHSTCISYVSCKGLGTVNRTHIRHQLQRPHSSRRARSYAEWMLWSQYESFTFSIIALTFCAPPPIRGSATHIKYSVIMRFRELRDMGKSEEGETLQREHYVGTYSVMSLLS